MSEAPPIPPSAPRGRLRPDRLLGTRIAGKYKMLKKIGEGGMGSVYIANQEPIDRKVAVKVLLSKLAEDEVAVKRFEQEARAISRMSHPNTVTIYDYGRVDDDDGEERLYIVMEYLKGSTLTQVLRKEGALPGPRASRILRQVCSSLADAHGAGIIHRDLKPDNIFLSELGGEKDWVKVLDFGVAKLADSESAGTLTQTGMIFGTPKYMSPEQAEGKPIDYRADIYALGVVLYELLTGKPPFISDTAVGLLLKHISEAPRPFAEVAGNRSIDPRLEVIVMRALEKHPDRRQQQVTELQAELEQYERAVTGPQAIPTDVGRFSSVGPAPHLSGALPTEVVPGASSAYTPSGLPPADRVPGDLSAGLSGSTHGPTFALPGAEQSTAPAMAGAAGFAAPGASPTSMSATQPVTDAEPTRPRQRSALPWIGAAAVVVVVGAAAVVGAGIGTTQVLQVDALDPPANEPPGLALDERPTPTLPSIEEEKPPEPAAVTEPEEIPKARPKEPSVRPRPEPPPLPAKVTLRLRSEPSGATVWQGGRQAGVTPFDIDLPRSDERLTFRFEKRGYADAEAETSLAEDRNVVGTLMRRSKPSVRRCPDGSKPPCQSTAENPVQTKVDDLK